MYFYDVEFVLEAMVIITSVGFDESGLSDEFVIEKARQNIISYVDLESSIVSLEYNGLEVEIN